VLSLRHAVLSDFESAMHSSADIVESLGHLFQGSEIESRHADGGGKSGFVTPVAHAALLRYGFREA
jgi:hypothetical protein